MVKRSGQILGFLLLGLGMASCNNSSSSVNPIGDPDAAAANAINTGTDDVLNNPVSQTAKHTAVGAANAVYGTANAISETAVGHPLTAGIPPNWPTTWPSTQPTTQPAVDLVAKPKKTRPPQVYDTDTATVVIVNGRTTIIMKPPPEGAEAPF
jgi:hypothetical protein